jgi:hypothetical protein
MRSSSGAKDTVSVFPGRIISARARSSGAAQARESLEAAGDDTEKAAALAIGHRRHKVAAKSKLDLAVPVAEAATDSGYGEAVLSVFRATNLLSPFEKNRLQDILRGSSADPLIATRRGEVDHRDLPTLSQSSLPTRSMSLPPP